jgi:hypothetical protein
LQHHLGNQLSEYQDTIDALKENTYVDNLMHGGEDLNRPLANDVTAPVTMHLEDNLSIYA